MHEQQGVFCKSVISRKLDKFADGKKNHIRPDLAGPRVYRRGAGGALTHGLGPVRWRGGRADRGWALERCGWRGPGSRATGQRCGRAVRDEPLVDAVNTGAGLGAHLPLTRGSWGSGWRCGWSPARAPVAGDGAQPAGSGRNDQGRRRWPDPGQFMSGRHRPPGSRRKRGTVLE